MIPRYVFKTSFDFSMIYFYKETLGHESRVETKCVSWDSVAINIPFYILLSLNFIQLQLGSINCMVHLIIIQKTEFRTSE